MYNNGLFESTVVKRKGNPFRTLLNVTFFIVINVIIMLFCGWLAFDPSGQFLFKFNVIKLVITFLYFILDLNLKNLVSLDLIMTFP